MSLCFSKAVHPAILSLKFFGDCGKAAGMKSTNSSQKQWYIVEKVR